MGEIKIPLADYLTGKITFEEILNLTAPLNSEHLDNDIPSPDKLISTNH